MKTTASPLRQCLPRNGLRMLPLVLVLPLAPFVPQPCTNGQVYSWSTIAGSTNSGSADGTNSDAQFHGPAGLVLDSANNIFVTDKSNHTIRKMAPLGTNWVVSTIAGSAGQIGSQDGTNNTTRFYSPNGITVDSDGVVYVADPGANRIRKVAPDGTNWVVMTIAGTGTAGSRDGTNKTALFSAPNGISVDGSGDLWVASGANETVRRITRSGTNWVTQTLAGDGTIGSVDGTNLTAEFHYPSGAAPDNNGNVFVTDQGNHTIRKLTLDGTNWVVSTIAGLATNLGGTDGTNSDARFNSPAGLAVDAGGSIYVAEYNNCRVRKIVGDGTNWVVSTIGGPFGNPNGVALDSHGNVYVAEQSFNRILRGIPLPIPKAPMLSNDTLTLTWNAACGQLLQVQFTTDLSQTNWTNLGDQFICTNSTVTVPESIAPDVNRLYRVVVAP